MKYINSFYQLGNDDLKFVRIVKDSALFHEISGFLKNDRYNLIQKITSKKIINESEIGSISESYKARGFKDFLYKKDEVLFVQLRIKGKEYFDVLDLRHELENKINKRLIEHQQGSCIAGDDGNMLFEVKDFAEGYKIILDVLTSSELNDEFVIAKRLYLTEDNWMYEIIYPIFYIGEFNSM